MAIYALGELEPKIHGDAFVHPDAIVIGDVTIGAFSSIWPGAVLRGDNGSITIGKNTSIQDNSVIHTTPQSQTTISDNCLIGHIVHLEGCVLDEWAQVSSGAVVLHRAHIGRGAIVAANAVVLNDVHVPAGALAVGIPAVVKLGRARIEDIQHGVEVYVSNGQMYKKLLRRLD